MDKPTGTDHTDLNLIVILKGVLLTMLLSTLKTFLLSLNKNDRFWKMIGILSSVLVVWFIGHTPQEFNHVTVWLPVYLLVDICATITLSTFVVFMFLVIRRIRELGWQNVRDFLTRNTPAQ